MKEIPYSKGIRPDKNRLVLPEGSIARDMWAEISNYIYSGAPAVLEQVAVGPVAVAVEKHSRFMTDLIGRTRGTVGWILSGTLADGKTAQAGGKWMMDQHAGIEGVLEREMGGFPQGFRYTARDPFLMRWVFATLLSNAVRSHELFIGPLTPMEKDLFVAESREVGKWIGIHPDDGFLLYEDVQKLYTHMAEKRFIWVDESAKKIASAVLSPFSFITPAKMPVGGGLRDKANNYVYAMSVGQLDPRIRSAYGFPWTEAEEAWFRQACAGIRETVSAIPQELRHAVPKLLSRVPHPKHRKESAPREHPVHGTIYLSAGE